MLDIDIKVVGNIYYSLVMQRHVYFCLYTYFLLINLIADSEYLFQKCFILFNIYLSAIDAKVGDTHCLTQNILSNTTVAALVIFLKGKYI